MEKVFEKAIKEFLDTGDSVTSIAEKYNLNRYELSNKIKEKYNIDIKEYSRRKREEFYEYIYQEYTNSEISMKQICKNYHITQRRFTKYIEDRNIEDNIVLKQEYQVNKNIFKTIDSEEKAYWLGFLYADGYNSGSYIQLTIAKQDFNHLKKFRNFLSSTHPIRYRHQDNTVNITVSDFDISTDLSILGCVKGKTYCCDFPGIKSLKRIYLRDFIRGFFDGDGTIKKMIIQDITSANSIKRKVDKVSFTIKSKTFSEKLAHYIGSMCKVKPSIYYYEPLDRYEVYIEGQINIRTFLDCIYKEANVFLDRKYEQYLRYILPSDLEIDQIISAELSRKVLPNLYESENKIDKMLIKEQSEPKVFIKELDYGNIIDDSNIDQGQRIEEDPCLK